MAAGLDNLRPVRQFGSYIWEVNSMRRSIAVCLVVSVAFCGCPTPPPTPLVPGPLTFKEKVFLNDMLSRFVIQGQAMCKLNRPTVDFPLVTYNMPDNAYMTGIYLGALSLKYSITHDPATKQEASDALKAVNLLCNVSGIKGLLARAAVKWPAQLTDDGEWYASPDNEYIWRANVSSDQMDGIFFGLALAFDFVATDAEKEVIRQNVRDLVDYLIANGNTIIDADGEPTTWGHYEYEYVTEFENMNALLFLQHLKIAAHVTGDPYYINLYQEWAVNQGYADIAITARVMGDPLNDVNHSDDVLQFLAYYPLLRLETDPALRAKYVQSLQRSWDGADGFPGTSAKQNPIYAVLAHAFLNDTAGNVDAINTLTWFPYDYKWTPETIAGYEAFFGVSLPSPVLSPEPAEGAVVPIDRRGNDWSALVQNPYRAGNRDPNPPQEFNGHDYLISYWLLRFHGILAVTD
jgi:hypothetical protein